MHLLHPHPLLIPSLVSCRSKSHSPKYSFFAPNYVAWRPPSIRDILGVSTPPLNVRGEASLFKQAGRCGVPRHRALTPISSCRKCHQHQLLGRPQPPGPVLQDGRGVRQVHRVRQKVSSARGCHGGRRGCGGGGQCRQRPFVFLGPYLSTGCGVVPQPGVTLLLLQVVLPCGR